jgi:hypothetical protein
MGGGGGGPGRGGSRLSWGGGGWRATCDANKGAADGTNDGPMPVGRGGASGESSNAEARRRPGGGSSAWK